VAELPAGTADRRGVHNGSKLFDVLHQKTVKERLVTVVQGCQPYVPLQGVGLAAKVLQLQAHLVFDAGHPPGQKAPELKSLALVIGEGGIFVEFRPGEQVLSSRHS
jgi:hypothetical protein